MRRDWISRTQLMCLLWAGVMAPAAELLPVLLRAGTGKGAWLAVILSAPLVLAAGWLLEKLAGEQGLPRAIISVLGKGGGRAVLLLYMVWAQLLAALRLRLCAQRLVASGGRDGSVWYFLLAMAALLLWMGRGRLGAFARAGQLFLAALLVTAGVVLVLSVFQAKPERLLPLWWSDGPALAKAALSAAGMAGWGLFAAFLIGEVKDQGEKKSWFWLSWGLGGVLLLAAAQAVILGNLGAGLAARLSNPFFALAKSVGVDGAFQRVEGVVASLWTFADLIMGGILIFAIRAMGEEIFPRRAEKWVPWAAVLIGAALALTIFPALGTAEEWNNRLIPMGNLLLGLALPALLGAVDWFRRRAYLVGKRPQKPKM